MHDEVPVGVDVSVVVVARLKGGVDGRVVELVQPVEETAIGVRVRGDGWAQLGVAIGQLAQRLSVGRWILGCRRRVVEMQLFCHRYSKIQRSCSCYTIPRPHVAGENLPCAFSTMRRCHLTKHS